LQIRKHIIVLLLSVLCSATGSLAQQERYTAVLSDGGRVSGDKLTGWQAPGRTVRLGDTVLAGHGKSFRWFRNSALRARDAEGNQGGYVEFVGGDRITGNVVGRRGEAWADNMYVPPHVVLHPATSKRAYTHGSDVETVRLLTASIKRIVLHPSPKGRFQAGTLFQRDGRRVSFTHIRWRESSVQLLLKNGTRTVLIGDIAEIHMPQSDPWKAYYRELAVLSPGCRSRLIRIETTDGLIATASEARFGAKPFFSDDALTRAYSHRRSYNKHIDSMKAQLRQLREKYEKDIARYDKQIADAEASIKRETESHKKAMEALKLRQDKERKDNHAKAASHRKKLQQDYQKAVAEIEKRVARMPEKQRESRRKHDIDSKKRELDRSLKTLVSAETSAEKKRLYAIAQLKKDLDRKLSSIVSSIDRAKSSKARPAASLAHEQARYSEQLELYKQRLDALPGPDGNPDSWQHMLQPAWSLDPLWVPFKTIRMRWSFAPETLPLSRVLPTKTVSPAMLSWRADRNTDGGLLRSGELLGGWGFGVHAYSELSFTLPSAVRSFQTRLGLDRMVDSGGCVRARVYLGSTQTKPLYESPLLIGSGKTTDTGAIRIPSSPDSPPKLILQVDPANHNHPPDADPLNIRDKLDWIEPQLIFDAALLRREVTRNIALHTPVWRGWTPSFDKRGVYAWDSWHDLWARYERGLFLPAVSAKTQPLKLSREMKIPAGDKWLVVDVGSIDRKSIDTQAVRLRIGDKEIPAEKIPVRQWWRPRTVPLVYSIANYSGKEVKLELSQRPDGKKLYWRAIATSRTLPGAYTLKAVLDASGKGDMQVSRGLGRTLESGRIKKSDVLEALEVYRLGGRVTFCNAAVGQLSYGYLYGAMIGCDWSGGDKTFEKLKDMKWLRMIVISKDCGVSAGAIARLKSAKGAEFVIRPVHRTPSAWGGMSCVVTVRNRRSDDVLVSLSNDWGGLTGHRLLKPGAEIKLHAHEGYRFEAHKHPGDYNKTPPISRAVASGDTVWEIK